MPPAPDRAKHARRAFLRLAALAALTHAACPARCQPAAAPPRPQAARYAVMTLKELLPGLPADDLVDFAKGLRLQNGVVVSADLAPMQRTMDPADIEAVNDFLAARPREPRPKPPAPSPLVVIADLLKDAPPRRLADFCGSLTIRDGRVVSLSARGLARAKLDAGPVARAILPQGELVSGSACRPDPARPGQARLVPAQGWMSASDCR